MERIAILGSTGSIGTQALQLIDKHKDRFEVTVLSAANNWQLLLKQVVEFKPEYVYLKDKDAAEKIKPLLPKEVKLHFGELEDLCQFDCVDTVIVSVVGIAGLPAVFKCIEYNKKIALANKEALVTGGALVNKALKEKNMRIYPVDSEHSAIFQSISDNNHKDIQRILLTASGGPFRTWSADDIYHATVEQALAHPNWNMGKKVTIDSASMMNKAFEIIEAYWLFGVESEKIEVLVHPQSILHSAVEFTDNCVLAQLGVPDMKMPIMFALSMPDRIDTLTQRLDLSKLGTLTFEKPDTEKFPCLNLAYEALKTGKTSSVVLNAANEIAVEGFLNHEFVFGKIYEIVRHAMEREELIDNPDIDDIYYTDKITREHTREFIKMMKGN